MEPLFTFEAHVPLEQLATWTPARVVRHLDYYRGRPAAPEGVDDAGF